MRHQPLLVAALLPLALAACQTKHDVNINTKPIEATLNINLSGRLELVITDARRDLEAITGEKAKRTVSLQDLGLPASGAVPTPTPSESPVLPPAPPATHTGAALPDSAQPTLLLAAMTPLAAGEDARVAELTAALRSRYKAVAAFRDTGAAGEAHTGLLVARGPLSPDQQTLLNTDNADRSELYRLEAARKGTPVDQIALGYFVARVEHVNKGNWVERFNKSTNTWEWFKWDR